MKSWLLNTKRAFTIIELLVVIVIIGILAAVVIVSFSNVSSRGIVASLQSDLASAKRQLINFQTQSSTSSFPTAINCSSPSASEICIRPSGSNTFSYTPIPSSNPSSFNLRATNGSTTYWVSDVGRVTTSSSNIVSSGLILNLDAGDATSYPGTGTTWTDKSSYNQTATLVNSPAYSTASSGMLSFGFSKYAFMTYNTTGAFANPSPSPCGSGNLTSGSCLSIVAWVRPTSLTTAAFIVGINSTNGCATPWNFIIDLNGGPWGGRAYFLRGTSAWDSANSICTAQYLSYPSTAPSNPFSLNSWVQIAVTVSGTTVNHYINTNQYAGTWSGGSSSGSSSGAGSLLIANTDAASTGLNGSLGIVMIYNKELTQSEITQNYNALKDRYGL